MNGNTKRTAMWNINEYHSISSYNQPPGDLSESEHGLNQLVWAKTMTFAIKTWLFFPAIGMISWASWGSNQLGDTVLQILIAQQRSTRAIFANAQENDLQIAKEIGQWISKTVFESP